MSGIRTMQQGIQAIHDGNLAEGARLLRISLLDNGLTASMRAVVYIWMAETDTNPAFKMQCYNEALAADPNNAQAKERLEALMATSLPSANNPASPTPSVPSIVVTPLTTPTDSATPTLMPPPPSPVAAAPSYPVPLIAPANNVPQNATFYQTVGIIDGPNGAGTGFFISQDGILATTRQAIGTLESVTVSLDNSGQTIGRVIRSYGDVDLSLVRIDLHLAHILPMTNVARVPDNSEIVAKPHQGTLIRGRVRATTRDLKPHWIPTNIREIPDIGGEPVFDERNNLIGMLTRNASRTSTDVYALHIHTIMARLAEYQQALQADPQRTYCANCGYISRAANFNAFYCEQCGAVLPTAQNINRYPIPQMAALYAENQQRACRTCSSRVGYYDGRCLRCGSDY
jgi:S1-C subfamily serine protease